MRKGANNYPILILGAGIGGLTAAYALHKQGFNVEVFEQAKSPILEENIGLRLWSNASEVLYNLGLHEQVRAAGMTIDTLQIRTAGGRLLTENSFRKLAQDIGAPSIGMRHADLMRILLDACQEIPIHLDSRCVAYSPTGDGVELRLENGEGIPGNVIIAADGLYSVIRAQLVGDGNPEYSGHTLWRSVSAGPADLKQGTVYTAWGTNNVHAGCWYVDAQHITWFIRADAPSGKSDAPGTVKPHLQELMKVIKGPFAQLLDQTSEAMISRTDIYVRPRVAYVRWEPIALLGDASHAMPNLLGQGVSQTIEDSLVLARSLAEAPDAKVGLALYENRRLPRVKWVREQVDRADQGEAAQNPLLWWLRNRMSHVVAPDSTAELWRELVTLPD